MAFSYKRAITIDETLCGTADSTNYPLGFFGTYDGTGGEPDLRSTGNGGRVAQASGYDIAFYSDSDLTTILDYERVSWSATTGAIEFWIRIPTLSTSANTVIYMAYGDSGASDLQDIVNTWNSNFKCVLHMQEDPTGGAPQFLDSTSNNNDGTVGGTFVAGDSVAAKIGKGLTFTTTDSTFVKVTNSASINSWTNMTVEMWLKATAGLANYTRVIEKGYADAEWTWIFNNGSATNKLHVDGNVAAAIDSTTVLADGSTYFYVVLVNTGGTGELFINGVSEDSATITSGVKTGDVYIGSYDESGYYLDGVVDEVRITTNTQSTSYITATYNNTNAPGTFYSIGAETAVGGGSTPISARIGIYC